MNVVIIDSDDISRAAIRKALEAEGLGTLCEIISTHENQPVGFFKQAAVILVGKGLCDQAPQPNVKDRDCFERPLRLGALLSRVRYYQSHSLVSDGAVIHVGSYRLDPFKCEWRERDGAAPAVRLTEKEVHILEFLAESQGKTIGRQALLDEVWGYAKTVETHTLETHIYRLRQKIEPDPTQPQILLTRDGGYSLHM